jgi:hypothetical protein
VPPREHQRDSREWRQHAVEVNQAHPARPPAIGLPRKLAFDEVEIIGDRREISARPVGLFAA